jgi:hypothetical protein
MSIDRAVAFARQQLLILYKFNQPAWTLPILYMHPEFNGELIQSINQAITEIPFIPQVIPAASIRWVGFENQGCHILNGLMRVGRAGENDLVILEPWVSQRHAEIIYRSRSMTDLSGVYYLRDLSRFGSYVCDDVDGKWQKVHAQEFPLRSGMQLKFGSEQGQLLEFRLDV